MKASPAIVVGLWLAFATTLGVQELPMGHGALTGVWLRADRMSDHGPMMAIRTDSGLDRLRITVTFKTTTRPCQLSTGRK